MEGLVLFTRQKPRLAPLTCPHKEGMVASYSYMLMVKAERKSEAHCSGVGIRRTVDFVVLLHEYKGIKVDIAMEMDVRINTPVPSVLLKKLLFKEELWKS